MLKKLPLYQLSSFVLSLIMEVKLKHDSQAEQTHRLNIGISARCHPFLAALAAYVEAYDAIITGSVGQYMTLSQQIGGDVQKHVS